MNASLYRNDPLSLEAREARKRRWAEELRIAGERFPVGTKVSAYSDGYEVEGEVVKVELNMIGRVLVAVKDAKGWEQVFYTGEVRAIIK